MKTSLLAVVFLILSINIYSQNRIDPAKVFNKDTISAINTYNTKFVKGWNWASPGASLDSALFINFYHSVDLNPSTTDYYPNSHLMQPLNHPTRVIIGGRNQNRLFQAHSLYLNPTITVDSTSNFTPRAYDNTGAVFGFQYKSKVRILDSSEHNNKNYTCAILSKDSLAIGETHTVLKNIWKGDVIQFLNYEGAI